MIPHQSLIVTHRMWIISILDGLDHGWVDDEIDFYTGLVEMSTVLQGTVGHVMRLELNLLQQFAPPMKEDDSYWKNQQFTKMLVGINAIVAQ